MSHSSLKKNAKLLEKTPLKKEGVAVVTTILKPSTKNSTGSRVPLGNVPSGIRPKGAWTVVHEGMASGGRRAGRLEKRDHETGIWIRGEERLGSLAPTVLADTILQQMTINPKTFGPRTQLLSFPYAKFKFTKLTLHWVTGTPTTTGGVLYMGAYLDPDQAVPSGGGASILWTELGENVIEFQSYANANLSVRLRLDEQDPCFIDNTGDQRFGSQGTLFLGAGTSLLAVTGQWFVEYECKLIDENMEAFPSGALMASVDTIASGATGSAVFSSSPVNANKNATSGPFTNFVGDKTILVAYDAGGATGANMLFPKKGLYQLVLFCAAKLAASIPNAPPTLVLGANIGNPQFLDYGSGNIGGSADNEVMAGAPPGGLFDRLTNSGAASTSSLAGATASSWFFGVNVANSTATLTLPTFTSGALIARIILCRISEEPGTASTDRPGPVAVARDGSLQLSPSTVDYLNTPLAEGVLDATAVLAIVKGCLSAPASEADNATLVLEALVPDVPITRPTNWNPTTTATFLHPALGVVAWLVRTFGPVLADKALKVAREKLDKWLTSHKK
jgi:hypothetical protein